MAPRPPQHTALAATRAVVAMLLCIAFAAALTRAVDTHYLDTIAGADGDSSTVNGAFTVARFSKPTGVAINYGENGLYIAEYHSHRVRWMSFSTFATGDYAGNGAPGSATGPMTGGCLWYPRAMLFSPTHQRLFVANHGTAQVRAIDVAAATISIVAGSTPGASDGTPGQFAAVNGPSGFELSLDETVLYVSDRMNRAVRAVAPSGGHMSTVVGALEASGDSDGHATNAARLSFPWGLAMRKKRNTLFIFENGCIRQWVLATNMVSTFAGACLTPGFADLPGIDARFTEARGGVWDADEDVLYVMERAGHRIRHITLGRIMEVRTVAGTGVEGSVDGPTGVSQLKDPSHMVMDRFNGGVIIADTQNDEIRLLTPRWKSTVHAGTLGTESAISVPHSIVYHDRMLYGSSGRSCIYRLSTATTPTTPTIVIGTHGTKGNVDATGAAALMDDPIVSGVDASGPVAHLYFSSYGHRVMRRADMNTWVTSRVAGAPDSLAAVDGAYGANRISVCMSFARIKGGLGLFVDRWAHAVRTIDLNSPARTVTTLAGGLNINSGLDGVGLNARFSSPFAMAVRKWHTVYVMELIAHRLRHLDLVTLAVTTLSAGDGKGKGGPTLGDSKFVLPGFPSFSAAQDQLFIPEHGSNALRAIALEPSTVANDDSRVTTLIGRAGAELAVDRASNGGGLLARSKCTASVGRAPGGVFAVDHAGHTLRRVTPNAADPSGSAVWRVKNVAGRKTAEAACVASTSTVDGPQASGRITMPAGLAVDVATNSLFMSDYHGRRVRRVDLFTFTRAVTFDHGDRVTHRDINTLTALKGGDPVLIGVAVPLRCLIVIFGVFGKHSIQNGHRSSVVFGDSNRLRPPVGVYDDDSDAIHWHYSDTVCSIVAVSIHPATSDIDTFPDTFPDDFSSDTDRQRSVADEVACPGTDGIDNRNAVCFVFDDTDTGGSAHSVGVEDIPRVPLSFPHCDDRPHTIGIVRRHCLGLSPADSKSVDWSDHVGDTAPFAVAVMDVEPI